jgi:purine-binding chemotaxis protein CheW
VSVNAIAVSRGSWLLCRVGDRLIAVPLGCVVETMRPLPLRFFPGLPSFVMGVSLVRDAVVPVIHLGSLFGEAETDPARLVTITQDGRTVALAVDDVIGVRNLDPATLHSVPPLLDALEGGALSAIGTLDSDLLLVLGEARLVPDSVWVELDIGSGVVESWS